MGTVADLGPMPKPSMNRAMNMCHQVLTKPCQKQVMAEKQHVRNTVPRRPNQWLNGTVSQHPMNEQQRYGAALTSPTSQVDRGSVPPIPNCVL